MNELGYNESSIGTEELIEKLNTINIEEYAKKLSTDIYTLEDVVASLKKPNLDPRDEMPQPLLKSALLSYKTYLEKKYNLPNQYTEMNNKLDKALIEALGVESVSLEEKINIIEEKRTVFGGSKKQYTTKMIPLEELTAMSVAEKEAKGVVIQELRMSKLALMAF